jgi:hypothetical protein
MPILEPSAEVCVQQGLIGTELVLKNFPKCKIRSDAICDIGTGTWEEDRGAHGEVSGACAGKMRLQRVHDDRFADLATRGLGGLAD